MCHISTQFVCTRLVHAQPARLFIKVDEADVGVEGRQPHALLLQSLCGVCSCAV